MSEQISSRSLGLLRVLIITNLLFQLLSPWVSHRMDDQLGTLLLSWVMFLSSFGVLLGYKTRVSAAICAASFAAVHLYYGFYFGGEGIARLTEPVFVFQPLLLLALTPCGRSISIDRILEVRAARREGRTAAPETAPAWTLELFVLQTATIYAWAAHDMAGASWLSGDQLELHFVSLYGDADSLARHGALASWAARGAWLGLISCVLIVPGLLWRRTRPWVAAYAVVLQCATVWLSNPSLYGAHFNLMMVYVLLVCVPPARVHALVTTVLKGVDAAKAEEAVVHAEGSSDAQGQPRWQGIVALTLALLYFNVGPVRGQLLERERDPLA